MITYNLQFRQNKDKIFKQKYYLGFIHFSFLDEAVCEWKNLSLLEIETICKFHHRLHIEEERNVKFKMMSINNILQCRIFIKMFLFHEDVTEFLIKQWKYNESYFKSEQDARDFYYLEMCKVYPLIIKYF